LSVGPYALHPENEETTSEPKAPEDMMADGALHAQVEKWMSTEEFSQFRDDPNVESCGGHGCTENAKANVVAVFLTSAEIILGLSGFPVDGSRSENLSKSLVRQTMTRKLLSHTCDFTLIQYREE
jgi:hypothetical protein